MNVETPTRSTPTTPSRPSPHRRARRGLSLARLPRRASHGSTVVRVKLGRARRLYAYRVDGVAVVGDLVEVDTPYSGVVVTPVRALGRGAYFGPLQRARLIGGAA